jgi:alpha-galactosidase
MGWNSYNTFGGVYEMPEDVDPNLPSGVGLDERVIFETADALVASGMRDAGYVYLNLDDRWQDPRCPRDSAGVLRPDIRRFPNGMKVVGDYLHDRGLKFGIYTIANLLACGGEEGAGAKGFPLTGSLGREVIDAFTFAEWGVDFLKIDWCGVDEAANRGRAAEVFAAWNAAISAAGRPVVLSASTWGQEYEQLWAPQLTHLWRIGDDLPPHWEAVRNVARKSASPPWVEICGPTSGWNDPDMLEVGRPGLTLAECWTHLVYAAMTASPLLTSHDIRRMTPEISAMLLDTDIIAINQMPTPVATWVEDEAGWEVWRRPLANGGQACAVVNLADAARPLPAAYRFAGKEVDPVGLVFDGIVPAHGTRLTLGQP